MRRDGVVLCTLGALLLAVSVEPRLVFAAATTVPPRAAASPKPRVSRNPFSYRASPPKPVAAPRERVTPTPAPPSPSATPAAPAVRLVGLVRRGSELLCVIAVGPSVHVLAPGENADGYSVVSVQEDSVALKDPSGAELVLYPGR